MKIDVLLSTMYQNDFSIVEKCNIQSDAIVINQCDKNMIIEKVYPFGRVKMVFTTERGLSKSRNMALRYSNADICILCDDDIVYEDNYVNIVENAFKCNNKADMLVFNIKSMDTDKRPQERLFSTVKRVPFYKSFSSVHLAFNKRRIDEKRVCFNEDFGAGSSKYSFAEDSIFFEQVRKNGLKIYTYPAVFAKLYVDGSSWFNGFNKKYFYDLGAFLQVTYPIAKYVYKWYYPIRLKKKTTLSFREIIRWIDYGIIGVKQLKSYDEFQELGV